jgi:hypothetical protein
MFLFIIPSSKKFHDLFYSIFLTMSRRISHNVPAVYDVLAARIRKCVAFPGPKKCGGVLAWE